MLIARLFTKLAELNAINAVFLRKGEFPALMRFDGRFALFHLLLPSCMLLLNLLRLVSVALLHLLFLHVPFPSMTARSTPKGCDIGAVALRGSSSRTWLPPQIKDWPKGY